MHQNAFGGRAPPGPAGGAYALPAALGATPKGIEGRGLRLRGAERGRPTYKEDVGRRGETEKGGGGNSPKLNVRRINTG